MHGHLYRYPHPSDATKFIYVGQGPKRDIKHRAGQTPFGRKFKRDFPEVELPQPMREQFEVIDQDHLNVLETVWMFQYKTWAKDGGYNLILPGSTDYKNMGLIGARLTVEKKIGVHARTPEQMSADGTKAGRVAGAKNRASGHMRKVGLAYGRINGLKNKGRLASLQTRERLKESFAAHLKENPNHQKMASAALLKKRPNHHSIVGRIGGSTTKDRGVGIFAPENRGKGGRIQGPIQGRKNAENKTGICGQSQKKGKRTATKAVVSLITTAGTSPARGADTVIYLHQS